MNTQFREKLLTRTERQLVVVDCQFRYLVNPGKLEQSTFMSGYEAAPPCPPVDTSLPKTDRKPTKRKRRKH